MSRSPSLLVRGGEDNDSHSDTSEDRGWALIPAMGYNEADYEIDEESLVSGLVDSDEDDEASSINHCLPEEYLKYDPTPDTPYPKPDWITWKELRARKQGFASSNCQKRLHMDWFQTYARGSLWMIQRLQLEKKLQGHVGPVNCMDFNTKTDLLCSSGGDMNVCIWDWQSRSNNLRAKIPTGHTANVFQSQFCKSDTSIVTTSRDGTVRILNIETGQTELIMTSSGEISGLTFIDPNIFLTCGTNASVNSIDLRTGEHRRCYVVRNPKDYRTCPLYTIDSNPIDRNTIAVSGSSAYVYLYDLRRAQDLEPKNYLAAADCHSQHIVTSVAYNSIGDKLLVSYNYDDLYVFNSTTCAMLHRYKGHRNKSTIKGCAWFGDNYVLSGSDCGHIYGWDLKSEHIVCFLRGDTGIVNNFCVHPTLPILTSSGLDSDIKVWEPISNTWPQTMKGIKPQICKNFLRRKRANERRTGLIGELIESDANDDDFNDYSSREHVPFDDTIYSDEFEEAEDHYDDVVEL